jgi:hypothetical protein
VAAAVPRQEGQPVAVECPENNIIGGTPERRINGHGRHISQTGHAVETTATDDCQLNITHFPNPLLRVRDRQPEFDCPRDDISKPLAL